MIERKEIPMTITDADIERALRSNLLKLDMLPDVAMPFDPEADERGNSLDDSITD